LIGPPDYLCFWPEADFRLSLMTAI
jgi:hypothetical protein